jgi:hypothetical protein
MKTKTLLTLGLLMTAALVATPSASAEPLPHADVFLPQTMGCLWTGSYKVLFDSPVVTIWHYTCDPPT